MNVLLILSSKLVSDEMRNLFGQIPSSLIPVNGKTLLEIIYENNKNKYDKIIVTGKEKVELISEVVKNKKMNINVFEIDELKDIGYSIFKALESLNKQEIKNLTINFADTYYSGNLTEIQNKNTYLYTQIEESERWATFDLNKKNFKITEKKDLQYKEKYDVLIGIFNFINYSNFFKILSKFIENNFEEERDIDSFYKCIEEFYKNNSIELIDASKEWEDYGHYDYYYNLKKQEVDAREFNSIEVDRKKGILVKKSKHKEKLIKEIQWYLKLPKNLEYLSPRIFDYSLSYENPYISMEYYSYSTLHELYVYGDYSLNGWRKIFNRLLEINLEFQKYNLKLEKEEIRNALLDMYYKKTIDRLEQLRDNKKFEMFFQDIILINEKEQKGLNFILLRLKDIIKKNGLLNTENYNIIHGDYFFANILYDNRNNIVRLIDPRGNFGGYGIYGDNNYELAKLLHSLDGKYDLIVEDLFEVNLTGKEINYRIFYNQKQDDIKNLFYEKLKEYGIDKKKIQIIESLLFLSMVPLHSDSYDRQLLMISLGIEKINKFLKEEDE